jgi:hypothetical protein
MDIQNKKLNEIINFIEKYGMVKNVEIKSNAIYVAPMSIDKPTRIVYTNINNPSEYTISFVMGDIKENL